MLKAFIDDSNMGQGPIAVLAGWLAPVQVWAKFSEDWNNVLRMRPRIDYFKWKEMRGPSGAFTWISDSLIAEKLNLLIGVLDAHKPVSISSVMSNDLHRQIFGENPDKIVRGPYFLSFYSIVVQIVEYVAEYMPGERVDFIFDNQPGQMEAAVAAWDRLKQVAPDNLRTVIGNVSFCDDKEVLPLQAADLCAGWTREQAEAFLRGDQIPEPPWGKRGDGIASYTRTWTVDVYTELAARTGAFKMPSTIVDPASGKAFSQSE